MKKQIVTDVKIYNQDYWNSLNENNHVHKGDIFYYPDYFPDNQKVVVDNWEDQENSNSSKKEYFEYSLKTIDRGNIQGKFLITYQKNNEKEHVTEILLCTDDLEERKRFLFANNITSHITTEWK